MRSGRWDTSAEYGSLNDLRHRDDVIKAMTGCQVLILQDRLRVFPVDQLPADGDIIDIFAIGEIYGEWNTTMPEIPVIPWEKVVVANDIKPQFEFYVVIKGDPWELKAPVAKSSKGHFTMEFDRAKAQVIAGYKSVQAMLKLMMGSFDCQGYVEPGTNQMKPWWPGCGYQPRCPLVMGTIINYVHLATSQSIGPSRTLVGPFA